MQDSPKDYYRPDEVAVLLNVHVETVRRWARDDIIEHVHLPRRGIRIPLHEVERLLAEHNQCSAK